jgi:hypothetical protein
MADTIADFVGDKRLRGPLPGEATRGERLEAMLGVLISAALAFMQLWRMVESP